MFFGHDLHFEWPAEPGQLYRVQIARDPQFRRLLTDQTQSNGSLTWRRPWPGRYYIRVSPGGDSLPGEGIPFDVPVPLWMRIAAPIVVLTPLLL